MDKIKNKILSGRDKYKNTREVMKYIEDNPSCINCKHVAYTTFEMDKKKNSDLRQENSVNFAEKTKISAERNFEIEEKFPKEQVFDPENKSNLNSISSNLKNLSSESNIETAQSISAKISAARMGLKELIRTERIDMPKYNEEAPKNIVKLYLDFVNSADLTDSKVSVKIFNVHVFCNILNENISDPLISKFVKKVCNDPVCYEKERKIDFLNILIFTYIYCRRNGIETKVLKQKIEEFSYLFKPRAEFNIDHQNDKFIDKFIIKLKINNHNYNEALFLNRVYLHSIRDKSLAEAFHKRLVDSLNVIDFAHINSFLKNVFTQATVLYSCISQEQLIGLIVSFYRTMDSKERLFNMLEILIEKTDDLKMNEFLSSEIRKLEMNTVKYRRRSTILEVRDFKTFNEYKDFFIRNSESFDCISIGFEELRSLFKVVRGSQLQILELLIGLFGIMKIEFLNSLANSFFLFLIEICESIQQITEEFVSFNKQNWNSISKIILTGQRIGLSENTHEKKKKCGQIKISHLLKLAIRLSEIITNLEDKAVSQGFKDIVKLKKKAFKID
jgi:hypothetical protein